MTYDCKEFKSSLIKQIVLLYDFILMYFEVNAEYEVRIPLYELPEKYRDDNFFGATRKIEILIREVQTDLDLWHLGIVREEMKIWKKLWEKWGVDTKFIPWEKPFFLPSQNPDTWGSPKEVRELMDDIEIVTVQCLKCESKVEDSSHCHECGALLPKNLRTCYLVVIALIRRLGNLYTFITDNDISISADTFQNRCTSAEHQHHWNRLDECSIGNWTIPPRVKEYITSYPDGFATLDAISNKKIRKKIKKTLVRDFPFLSIDKIEYNNQTLEEMAV